MLGCRLTCRPRGSERAEPTRAEIVARLRGAARSVEARVCTRTLVRGQRDAQHHDRPAEDPPSRASRARSANRGRPAFRPESGYAPTGAASRMLFRAGVPPGSDPAWAVLGRPCGGTCGECARCSAGLPVLFFAYRHLNAPRHAVAKDYGPPASSMPYADDPFSRILDSTSDTVTQVEGMLAVKLRKRYGGAFCGNWTSGVPACRVPK